MRRLKLNGQLTGHKRIVEPASKRRASLRYDAWRLLKDDGRISVQMFVKLAAHQLAKSFTDMGHHMVAVPAYEEEIREIHNDDDFTHTAEEEWPDGIKRTSILYFGLPK